MTFCVYPTLLAFALAAAPTRPHRSTAAPAPAAAPQDHGKPVTADMLVQRYDAMMAAHNFDGDFVMRAHREDGSERSYGMRILKWGDDKMRVWFAAPASVKGQEILRAGDNLWMYMPNLKRALRMASRDAFLGGDFNNADILRVNYALDYSATLGDDSRDPETHLLLLTAKTSRASYEHIRLWMRKIDSQPVRGEYFAQSGKLLREATFGDYRTFGNLMRPARVTMQNSLAKERFSVLSVEAFDTRVQPDTTLFQLDALGR